MRELNRALADILEIRSQIAAGTAFRGYGPATVALTGAIGISTAIAQSLWPQLFAYSAQAYIICWFVVGGICAAAIRIEMQGRSRRLHSDLANTLIGQAVEQFLPAAVAGMFLPLFLLRFAPQSLWMMPGALAATGEFRNFRFDPKPPAQNDFRSCVVFS